MSESWEDLAAEFEKADDYHQEWQLKGKRIEMPPDPEAWLVDLERRVKDKAPKLPEPVRSEYYELMASQVKVARNWLAQGNEKEIRTMFALLLENYRNLVTNVEKNTAYAAQGQRKDAGFSSGEERRAERAPEWKKWQLEAERIFEKNKAQSKNQICTAVAEKFGVSTRAVSNRVKNVGKERPRSKK